MGYDAHSYAYRDLEGSKVHRALREAYGQGFAEGDVVGCLLHLPPGGRPFETLSRVSVVMWITAVTLPTTSLIHVLIVSGMPSCAQSRSQQHPWLQYKS